MLIESNVLPWFLTESCKGCGNCVSACGNKLLQMIEDSESGIPVPWLEDVDRCTGCGECQAACPWSAVCLTNHVGEARRRFIKGRPLALALA